MGVDRSTATIGKTDDLFRPPQAAASSSSETDTRSVVAEYPVVRGPFDTGLEGATTVPTDAVGISLATATVDADVHDGVLACNGADEYSAHRQATTRPQN